MQNNHNGYLAIAQKRNILQNVEQPLERWDENRHQTSHRHLTSHNQEETIILLIVNYTPYHPPPYLFYTH